MSETALGEITKLANAEDQYLIANEAIEVLERLIMGRITIDFTTDADLVLNAVVGTEQWRDKFMEFTDTGGVLTGPVDVTWPDKNGPEYVIKNSTGQALTFKLSGQSGVALASGGLGRFYNNGTDMVAGP